MYIQAFRGTRKEVDDYIRYHGWDRPSNWHAPDWQVKKDGITKVNGEQAYLLLLPEGDSVWETLEY